MVKSNLKYVENVKPVVENKVEKTPVEGEGEQMNPA